MGSVAWHEKQLIDAATERLRAIPGLRILSMWGPASARVGIVCFTVKGWHPGALAAALSAEHGIGVRDGAFCAHLLLDALIPKGETPAALRASVGVGTTMDDIDRFIGALSDLCARGPQWRYRIEHGRYVPDPDPRPRPFLHEDLVPWGQSAAPSATAPCRHDAPTSSTVSLSSPSWFRSP
jgi:hypothetical protein